MNIYISTTWIWYFTLSCCFLDSVLKVCCEPEWAEWSKWGGCNAPCGIGERRRFRACDITRGSAMADKWCVGSHHQAEQCDTGTPCPDNGSWSEWGSWSICSATCGNSSRTRSRTCIATIPERGEGTCEGPSSDTEQCNLDQPCPVDGKWSKWSPWSTCSVTCGTGGTINRYRQCNSPPPLAGGKICDGIDHQVSPCEDPQDCPVNGHWSDWTNWSSCSVTCGNGQRTRQRLCDNPPPLNGGLDCSEQGDQGGVQTKSCSSRIKYCAVSGGWSQWSDFGECYSPDCFDSTVPSLSLRQRSCSDPYPQHNGDMCQGTFLEAVVCEDPINCRMDGSWSDWSDWNCTETVAIRSRTCDEPPPSNGGSMCDGTEVEFFPNDHETYEELCGDDVKKVDPEKNREDTAGRNGEEDSNADDSMGDDYYPDEE